MRLITRFGYIVVAAGLCACGASAPPAAVSLPPSCRGELSAVDRPVVATWAEVPAGPVAEVVVRGARAVPEQLVRDVIALPVGEPIDLEVVRRDIREILALSVFEDVLVHGDDDGGRLVVTYEVVERPLVRAVHLAGVGDGVAAHRLENVQGEVFVPHRLHRLAMKLTADHRTEGYVEAEARVRGRRVDDGSVDVCFVVDAGRRWVIDSFELEGNERIDDEELFEHIETFDGRVNAEGGVYREDLIVTDLQRILTSYYDRGMLDARVDDPRTEWDDDALRVVIPIEEGPVFRIGRVTVTGDLDGPADRYVRWLGLRRGAVFSRSEVADAMDRVRERDGRDIGLAPFTDIDHDRHVVDLELSIRDYSDAPDESAGTGAPGIEVQLTDDELRIDQPPAEPSP